MVISGAVEGVVDDAIVRRLLLATNHDPGPIHVKNGKANLLQKLDGYNVAAELSPWLVLLDLNGDATCAPTFVASHLPNPAPHMICRLAVRQVETWLLADRVRIARFLHIGQANVPRDPEALPNSKETLVNLARRSSDRSIREALVPGPGSGRSVGPAYVSMVIEFVERRWNPHEAAQRSDSLRRCIDRLAVLS